MHGHLALVLALAIAIALVRVPDADDQRNGGDRDRLLRRFPGWDLLRRLRVGDEQQAVRELDSDSAVSAGNSS